jgi:hypothetical protein
LKLQLSRTTEEARKRSNNELQKYSEFGKIETLESSKEKEKCQVEKNDDRQKGVNKMS